MTTILKNDYLYGVFWLAIILLIAFLPVLIGRQMLFEYASTVFSSSSGKFYQLPGIKTGWVWGGTNLTTVEAPKTISGIKTLKESGWPLWSSYAAGGYPLGADLISGFYFWPKLILFYLFPFLETFNYWLVLRLLIAGFGTFLFLKRLALSPSQTRLSRQAALVGAIAYMLSGHMIVNLASWWQNVVIVLPYVLWSFESYFQTLQKKYIGLSAIFLSLLILGGQPQTTVIDSLLISAYTLYRLFAMEDWRRLWRKYIGFLVLSGFLALAMALPMIIDFSTSFFNGISIHHHDPQVLKHFSLAQTLYFLVSPTMFLELALFGRIINASNPIVFQYYSIIVWLLALAGLCALVRNKIQYFFAGYLVFDFLKLIGVPPIHWISYVPPFNVIFWLEHDNTFAFSLAILAAFGYEKIKTSSINWKKLLTVAAAIPIIFTASFLFFRDGFNKLYLPNFDLGIRRADPMAAFNHLLERLPKLLAEAITYFFAHEQVYVWLLFASVFIFGALFLLTAWRAQKSNSTTALKIIIILLALELFVYMPKIRDGFFKPFNPYPAHPAITFLEENIAYRPWRFIGAKDIIQPHTSALWGLEDFRTNDAVASRRYKYYSLQFLYLSNIKHLKINNRPSGRPDIFVSNTFTFDEKDYTPDLHRFFDMANIKYMATEEALPKNQNLQLAFEGEGLFIYENKSVLPRAYLVGKMALLSNFSEAIKILSEPNYDYKKSVIIDGDRPLIAGLRLDDKAAGESKILVYQPKRLVISTDTSDKMFLVIANAFYPGWRAYVDGAETEIFPANVMFQTILVPSGKHNIEFIYKPFWFWPSVGLSFTGLLVVVYLCWPSKKRRSHDGWYVI